MEVAPEPSKVACVKCFGGLLLKARLVMAQLEALMVSEGSWLRSNRSHTCCLFVQANVTVVV